MRSTVEDQWLRLWHHNADAFKVREQVFISRLQFGARVPVQKEGLRIGRKDPETDPRYRRV